METARATSLLDSSSGGNRHEPAHDLTAEQLLGLLWRSPEELPGRVTLRALRNRQSAWSGPDDRETPSDKARRVVKTTDVYLGTALIDLDGRAM